MPRDRAAGEAAPSGEQIEEIEHYANGNVKYTGHRLDGEMHGEWRWYRIDGSIMRSGFLDHGRQVGTWRTYDRTGAVVKETAFGD